jgi:predicted XRE-type DNA-binding protein
MTRKIKMEVGSGNVFADLGLPDAESHFLKAQIVSEIYRLTNVRKLTQAAVGKLIGITQPEVSRMFRGHFREYSVERLMGFLTAFDRDVEIVVRPRKRAGKPAILLRPRRFALIGKRNEERRQRAGHDPERHGVEHIHIAAQDDDSGDHHAGPLSDISRHHFARPAMSRREPRAPVCRNEANA